LRNYLRTLLEVIGPHRSALPSVFGLFILLSVLEAVGIGLVVPLFAVLDLGQDAQSGKTGLFGTINHALESLGLNDPTVLLLLIVAVFYTKAVLGFFTQRAIYKFGYANQKRLIDSLVVKYQSMSVAEFSKKESSALIQNLIGNVEVVTLGSIVASVRLLSESTVILGIAAVLFIAQPALTVAMIILVVFVVAIYDRLFRTKIKQTGSLAAEAREKVIKNFQSVMQGFKEIHVIGRLEFFNRMIFDATSDVKSSAVDYKVLNTLPRYLMESAAITGLAAIFIVGGQVGASQADLVAAIGTFAVAALRLIPGANQVSAAIIQIRNSTYALEKVHEGMTESGSATQLLPKSDHPDSTQKVHRSIEFRKLGFAYNPGEKPVLNDANLKLQIGKVIGFKGSSGSGKSTALDIILGFYEPTSGDVLIDGSKRSDTSAHYRTQFAFVPQDPFVFSGTIRENITLGTPEDEHGMPLSKAVSLACLDEMINDLPDGLEMKLGEKAVNISGGQRQRIALARAIYLNRPILVLDEPTSALDHDTAMNFMASLKTIGPDKAVIITSHDPEIIDLCDEAFVFSHGKVTKQRSGAHPSK
jgi:ABC-type multidrug transport system fused ATPase/permease subunit